jgi:simple sugar transport system permease protein
MSDTSAPTVPTPHPPRAPLLRSLAKAPFLDALVLSLLALLISLLLFGLFVLCSGTNPLDVYELMFRGAFGSEYSWRSTMLHAAPLMLTALCVVMPARVGMVIIGGEGCVVLGGLMAAAVAHAIPNAQPFVSQTSMIVAGMTIGGLWIVLAGALRQFRGVNETISSLLLNYIAIAILNHCVEGPMHDPTSLDHPSSFPIGAANMLGNIPGTEIHYGLLFGLIACVLFWILMNHTTLGFASRIVGGNSRAARIAGLSIPKLSLLACFLGGASAALAGVVEVTAIHGHANDSLAAGYGYAGILIAFVARQNPIAVIPVSILLGGVAGSGDLLQSEIGLSSASVQVFQGMLFLVILGLDTWSGRLGELGEAMVRPIVWLARVVARKPVRSGVVHASA